MESALVLGPGDPTALALASAIRSGDVPALDRLLAEHRGLASARLADRKGVSRTPLHVATDWPGHVPNGAAVVAALVAAGADRPAAEELNQAFWQACHGGQRRAAAYLLAQGADPGYVPPYSKSTALEVAAAADGRRERLVGWLRGLAASS